MTTEAQQKALDAIVARVQAKHGKKAITTMTAGTTGTIRGVIPSPLEAMNRYLLGIGGCAWERITEVFGPEASGKSSLVMAMVAAVQKISGVGYYVDAENVLTRERAKTMGVDIDSLLMSPDIDSAEHAGALLLEALAATPPDVPFLGVWDSVAAMETAAEANDDAGMSVMARFLSGYCKKLIKALRGKAAHVIFVNQVRVKPGVVYGNPEYTPGGNALRFYSSVRIRTSKVKERDGGLEMKMKTVKNKLEEPHRELHAFLHFKNGWDDRWTTLNHAKDEKVIEPRAQSLEKARQALGWDVQQAAEALGAPAVGDDTITPPGRKRRRRGKE